MMGAYVAPSSVKITTRPVSVLSTTFRMAGNQRVAYVTRGKEHLRAHRRLRCLPATMNTQRASTGREAPSARNALSPVPVESTKEA
jgi:hypothetical protein